MQEISPIRTSGIVSFQLKLGTKNVLIVLSQILASDREQCFPRLKEVSSRMPTTPLAQRWDEVQLQ
jgi:hypothetical protein